VETRRSFLCGPDILAQRSKNPTPGIWYSPGSPLIEKLLLVSLEDDKTYDFANSLVDRKERVNNNIVGG
jgi:hypothetical protein